MSTQKPYLRDKLPNVFPNSLDNVMISSMRQKAQRKSVAKNINDHF